MSDLEQKELPKLEEWQANNLRLTAFLSPSAQIGEQDWWQTLLGELPDNKSSQPKTGIQQEEGSFKDGQVEGKLILIVQPTRVDWQLVPSDFNGSEIPTIGSFLDSVNSFLALMLRWLKDSPPIQRLAFGSSILQFVNSSQEGYKCISGYLPFDLDEDSSDFFYQINRPRQSTSVELPDLKINRLSRWGIQLLVNIAFSLNKPAPQRTTKPAQVTIALDLDINTAENILDELPSEQLSQIFKELVELGKEIAEKGDIK
ncbi:MAG: hypothetical protein ACRC2R_06650 [Xenococcaceae cyanobacterium]